MSWARDLERVRRLPPTEQLLVVEAIVWLALSRAAISALPFRRVAAWLRLVQFDPADLVAADPVGDGSCVPAEAVIEAVGRAVRGAAARTPWASTCLVQSLAAHIMLARRRVPSVVYLGVAKDPSGELVAHSWLRCGGDIVTGGGAASTFSPIASYQRAIAAGC